MIVSESINSFFRRNLLFFSRLRRFEEALMIAACIDHPIVDVREPTRCEYADDRSLVRLV